MLIKGPCHILWVNYKVVKNPLEKPNKTEKPLYIWVCSQWIFGEIVTCDVTRTSVLAFVSSVRSPLTSSSLVNAYLSLNLLHRVSLIYINSIYSWHCMTQRIYNIILQLCRSENINWLTTVTYADTRDLYRCHILIQQCWIEGTIVYDDWPISLSCLNSIMDSRNKSRLVCFNTVKLLSSASYPFAKKWEASI